MTVMPSQPIDYVSKQRERKAKNIRLLVQQKQKSKKKITAPLNEKKKIRSPSPLLTKLLLQVNR